MKILLLGNKGQVGREIAEQAIADNITISGFDIDTLDITDKSQVDKVFTENFDIVINAAAYTAVDKAEDEEDLAFAVNRDAVEYLAYFCKQHDIPLIHISTDYVFSGDKKTCYNEEDKVGPLGVYSKSKIEGEKVLMNTWHKYIILRSSWAFGRYGNNFVKTVLRLAQERESLNIVGDQYGCPTPAADIARVLLAIAKQIDNGNEQYGIYHYCGKPAVSWYEFAQEIIKLSNNKCNLNKITTAEYPTKAARPQNSELCVEKIIKDYKIDRHFWIDYLKIVIEEIES